MTALEKLLILSVVKPEVLPDDINLRKLGILDEKVWGPPPSSSIDKPKDK